MYIVYTVFVLLIDTAFSTQYTAVTNNDKYELGKAKYEEILRDSKMPRYSECWTNALDELQQGCASLTDDIQHRLTMAFSNCFLKKIGRPTYKCTSDMPIEDCTRQMTSDAMNVYTEFFTHTQNICFFLQAQLWQDTTEHTINRLSQSSDNMIEKTEYSTSLQESMIEKQLMSIHQGDKLKNTIEQSSIEMLNTVQDFKLSIGELFDRVRSIQNLMLGEVTGFYALIFYTCSVILAYLLTSTARTADARLWVLAVLTVNIICERVIVAVGAPMNDIDSDGDLIDGNELIYTRIWLCRKVFIFVAICVFSWCAYRYKDINAMNNEMLGKLLHQINDLQHMFKERTDSYSSDEMDGKSNTKEIEDTTSNISDSDSSDSDSTFVPDEEELDDIDESFYTVPSSSLEASRETTPFLVDELRDLHRATPMRGATPLRNMTPVCEMTPMKNGILTNFDQISVTESEQSTPRRRGRPKKSEYTPRRLLDTSENRPGLSRYNLRQSNGASPASPRVVQESVKQFSKIFKKMEEIADRRRSQLSTYSSDED